jgi:hypothetical protein
MGTGTLRAHDMVPIGLPASSRGPDEQRVRLIALDSPNLDKYWLYMYTFSVLYSQIYPSLLSGMQSSQHGAHFLFRKRMTRRASWEPCS